MPGLGVEAALSEIAGISPLMLIALGQNGIKTVEDLAGCATDDLHGWVEQTGGTTTRHVCVLDGFGLSRTARILRKILSRPRLANEAPTEPLY